MLRWARSSDVTILTTRWELNSIFRSIIELPELTPRAMNSNTGRARFASISCTARSVFRWATLILQFSRPVRVTTPLQKRVFCRSRPSMWSEPNSRLACDSVRVHSIREWSCRGQVGRGDRPWSLRKGENGTSKSSRFNFDRQQYRRRRRIRKHGIDGRIIDSKVRKDR